MSVNVPQDAATQVLDPALVSTYEVPRVNLLPGEILEARRLKRTQGFLVLGVAGVVALAAAGYLATQRQADDAEAVLTASQARTSALQAEQAKYAEVPRVLAEVDAAKSAQQTAMATDVLWYRYLNDLALTYPQNVWLTNMTASVAATGGATGEAAVPVAGSNPLATPGIGTITFTGTGLDHPDVAAWLEVLDGTEGFADAYFSSSQRAELEDQAVVQFSSTVAVTADALSHRFDREAQ
jgi:Tfp pilus assembly protein PilN